MTHTNNIELLRHESYSLSAKCDPHDNDLLFIVEGHDIYFEHKSLMNVFDEWSKILRKTVEKGKETLDGPAVY